MKLRAQHHESPDPKAAFFDRLARTGDAMRFRPTDQTKLARLGKRLGDLRGQRVLEPGCGSGPLTEWLCRRVGPRGHVTAFDPSPAMLDRCRKLVARRRNVSLVQTRCEEAGFPDRTFDRVVCFRVLPHFADLDAVLVRFARWLKPGGRLHIVHWEGREALAAIHGTDQAVAADVLPAFAELDAALRRHGFVTVTAIDNHREVYVEAVRR